MTKSRQTVSGVAHARRSLRAILAAAALCTFTACGQTGPLELPQDGEASASGAGSGGEPDAAVGTDPATDQDAEARRRRQDER